MIKNVLITATTIMGMVGSRDVLITLAVIVGILGIVFLAGYGVGRAEMRRQLTGGRYSHVPLR